MSEIADRLEVAELFARLARALDEGTADDLREIYTKDVVVHSPRGGEIHGIDDVIAYVTATHDTRTHHMNSDILVEVAGPRATASANQMVSFFHDGERPHRRSGLHLKYSAVRTPEGWRFDRANIGLAWQEV
jgi:uncharacterized protein (TIGR02246 family)